MAYVLTEGMYVCIAEYKLTRTGILQKAILVHDKNKGRRVVMVDELGASKPKYKPLEFKTYMGALRTACRYNQHRNDKFEPKLVEKNKLS